MFEVCRSLRLGCFPPLAEQLQAAERAKEKFHLDRAERIARP